MGPSSSQQPLPMVQTCQSNAKHHARRINISQTRNNSMLTKLKQHLTNKRLSRKNNRKILIISGKGCQVRKVPKAHREFRGQRAIWARKGQRVILVQLVPKGCKVRRVSLESRGLLVRLAHRVHVVFKANKGFKVKLAHKDRRD